MFSSELLSMLLPAKQLLSSGTQKQPNNHNKTSTDTVKYLKGPNKGSEWKRLHRQLSVMSRISCPWQLQCRQLVLGSGLRRLVVFPENLMKPLTYVKYVNTLKKKTGDREIACAWVASEVSWVEWNSHTGVAHFSSTILRESLTGHALLMIIHA